MKNRFMLFVVIAAFLGCSDGTNKEKEPETYRQTPVQNVNGNIPDTSNSIDLQTHSKSDNTKVTDTSQH